MPSVFTIRTDFGTLLHLLDDGAIGHMREEAAGSEHPRVLAYAADGSGTEVVLFTDGDADRPLSLVPDRWAGSVFPMRRLRLPDERYALAHPYSGYLMIALPEADAAGRHRCATNNLREASGWESFRFEQVEPMSDAVRRRTERADALLALARTGGLRTTILAGNAPDDIETVARLAPQRDFETMAADVQQDPGTAAASLAVAGSDMYAVGLQNLLATAKPSLPSATPPVGLDIANDARFAAMSLPPADAAFGSFVQKLNATARRQRRPARRLCVLATLRDEGPYLLEWIAYHRALGVEHFFLCSNDNGDGSDALLLALAHSGVVTWIENKGSGANVQAKAYGHMLGIVPGILDYEWAAIIDLDEFIALRPGGFLALTGYLSWQERQAVDVIALCWSVHWSNGHVRWSDQLSLARFASQSVESRLVKSIMRPRRFTSALPHHPISTDHSEAVIVRDSAGQQVQYRRGATTSFDLPSARYGEAWIDHHFSRSAEEFLWKWSRNRVSGAAIPSFAAVHESFITNFMRYRNDRGSVTPDAVSGRIPRVRAIIADLLALPGVGAAHRDVIQQRHERAARTSDVAAGLAGTGLSDEKLAFLKLLQVR